MEIQDKLRKCIELLRSIDAENEEDGLALLETAIHRSMPTINEWRKQGYFLIDGKNADGQPLRNQEFGRPWTRLEVNTSWQMFCVRLHTLLPDEFPIRPGYLRNSEVTGIQPQRVVNIETGESSWIDITQSSPAVEAGWVQKQTDYISVLEWMINRTEAGIINQPENEKAEEVASEDWELYEAIQSKNELTWKEWETASAEKPIRSERSLRRKAEARGLQIPDFGVGEIDLGKVGRQLNILKKNR